MRMRQHVGSVGSAGLPPKIAADSACGRKNQRTRTYEGLAACRRLCGDRLERLERFSHVARIATLFGGVEPYLSEGGKHPWLIRESVSRATERHHREIAVAGAKVRASDRNQAFRPVRVERVQASSARFHARLLLQGGRSAALRARENAGEIRSRRAARAAPSRYGP